MSGTEKEELPFDFDFAFEDSFAHIILIPAALIEHRLFLLGLLRVLTD